jgi:hypothetical protein
MTNLQITSLSQVKKLLDYGGEFLIKKENILYIVHKNDDDDIEYNDYKNEGLLFNNQIFDKYPLTFHSWLLAPPLKEGEEVYVEDDSIEKVEVDGVERRGTFSTYDGRLFNSLFAVPCRLLEEEKDISEAWAGSEYVDGFHENELEGQSQGEINMILGNKIDELAKAVNALKETTQPLKEMPQFEGTLEQLDKLTILSKKNNQ